MGNKICEFNIGYGTHSNSNAYHAYDNELSPIIEDKENKKPFKQHHTLMTPLKVRQNEIRSPLQDITPSMTHKKKEEKFNTKTNKKNKTSNKNANLCLEL